MLSSSSSVSSSIVSCDKPGNFRNAYSSSSSIADVGVVLVDPPPPAAAAADVPPPATLLLSLALTVFAAGARKMPDVCKLRPKDMVVVVVLLSLSATFKLPSNDSGASNLIWILDGYGDD